MAGNFPPELLQADGTIPAERATAALAVLKLMEGETILPGDHQAMLDAGLGQERIREIHANGRASQLPTPAPELSAGEQAEAAARADANAALERAEQRRRDVVAAKALLQEKYGEMGATFERWTDDEILSEAGIVLSEEQKRDAAIERENELFRSDPETARKMLAAKERELFLEEAPKLDPRVRQQRAASYGLTPEEVESAVEHHWKRRGVV